jgi:hypothetical protein
VLTCHNANLDYSSENYTALLHATLQRQVSFLSFRVTLISERLRNPFYFLSMAAKAADRVITGPVMGDGHLQPLCLPTIHLEPGRQALPSSVYWIVGNHNGLLPGLYFGSLHLYMPINPAI